MINVIMPKKKQGHVITEGHPGFGGIWPEYVVPNKDDSRCSCLALNTLANHGNVLYFQYQRLFFLTADISLKAYYHMIGRTFNSKKWVKPYEIHIISHQHFVILFLIM